MESISTSIIHNNADMNLPVPSNDLSEDEKWLVSLDVFEGPVDLLLTLARDQKLDLTKVSIVRLADQYLNYIEKAQDLRLEVAGDYLVMAAWLAYLKSKLLLPPEENQQEEPTGEQMAEALAFQLRRLEAMQDASKKIMALPQLGQNVFVRGMPEGVRQIIKYKYQSDLVELLKAYGDIKRQNDRAKNYQIAADYELFSIDQAVERVTRMLGGNKDWLNITQFIQLAKSANNISWRSALASTFGATLELAKQGFIEVRQDRHFDEIYLRAKEVSEIKE